MFSERQSSSRGEELRAEVEVLERSYQRDLKLIAAESEKASQAMVRAMTDKAARLGRDHTRRLEELRAWKSRRVQDLLAEREKAFEAATALLDKAFEILDAEFDSLQDAANELNSNLLMPLERAFHAEEKNLAEHLRERLEERKDRFQADALPFVQELQQVERAEREARGRRR